MALAYAKGAASSNNPLGVQSSSIISGIKYLSKNLSISPDIYAIGAKLVEQYAADDPSDFMMASEWYWLAGNKKAAIKCLKKGKRMMKIAKTNHYGTYFKS